MNDRSSRKQSQSPPKKSTKPEAASAAATDEKPRERLKPRKDPAVKAWEPKEPDEYDEDEKDTPKTKHGKTSDDAGDENEQEDDDNAPICWDRHDDDDDDDAADLRHRRNRDHDDDDDEDDNHGEDEDEDVQAERDYVSNSNPTGEADWHVFMRRLGHQQISAGCGIKTGYSRFDDLIGELRGVTILAGLTSSGKTSLSMNLVYGALRGHNGTGAVVFPLETGKDDFWLKLLSFESGIEYRVLKKRDTWTKDTKNAVKAASERLEPLVTRLRVVDSVPHHPEEGYLKSMLAQIIQFGKESKVNRILVVVDRIQKLHLGDKHVGWSDDGRGDQYAPYSGSEADDARMRMLINLQSSTHQFLPGGFPVIGTSRVNKIESGHHLTINDVPGSAEVVSQADIVLLLEPTTPASTNPLVTPTLLKVAKVRDGGRRGDVYLDFHHTVSRFEEAHGLAPKVSKKNGSTRTSAQNGADSVARKPPTIDPLAGMKP